MFTTNKVEKTPQKQNYREKPVECGSINRLGTLISES
jgi:hypothetical protein